MTWLRRDGADVLLNLHIQPGARKTEIVGLHGDALKMLASDGQPITFAEWGYLGKGKYQRRDFRLDDLTMSSTFSAEGSLFAHLGKHQIFTPIKSHPPITVGELAAALPGESTQETA